MTGAHIKVGWEERISNLFRSFCTSIFIIVSVLLTCRKTVLGTGGTPEILDRPWCVH